LKGSLIKQHRKFNNMTLEDLATGICSVSYLSKIEHNTINASEEIYRLLGERLNIKLNDINQNFDKKIYQDLLEWHEAAQLRDLSLMDDLKRKSELALEDNHNVELVHLYKIFQARHILTKEDQLLSKSLLKELADIYPDSTLEFQFFYHKTLGINHLMLDEVKEGLRHFLQANNLMERLPISEFEIYFHLSLSYLKTRSSIESIYYGEKAIEGYKNNLNYSRLVDTFMIVALNYRYLNIHSVAEEYFLKLLKFAKYHLPQLEKRRIFHNLGYIYANQEKYQKALHYLQKAQEIETSEKYFEIGTLYLLASTSYYCNDVKATWDYIHLGEQEAIDSHSVFFMHKFFVLRHTINQTTHDDEFIDKLENEIVPSMRELNEYEDYKTYLEMLGDIFYQKRLYKKSAMCFKEANNFRFTQKKDLL